MRKNLEFKKEIGWEVYSTSSVPEVAEAIGDKIPNGIVINSIKINIVFFIAFFLKKQ